MDDTDIDAILAHLDVDDVQSFGDLNGSAPALAAAIHRRYGAKINLLFLDDAGRLIPPSDENLVRYTEHLKSAGVDATAASVITQHRKIRPLDVIASDGREAARPKLPNLEPVLSKALHNGSRMVVDIKKGSGIYPFLRRYGGVNTLKLATQTEVGLAIMSVEPKETLTQGWATTARTLAGEKGFFTDCGDHSFVYVPRGDTLVVTFDNLDIAMTKRDDRLPWGHSFIEGQGWSMLGVMANGWTWFRDDAVTAEFDRLRDTGFFSQFKRVVFYGASMGGYAAAAYAAASPGSTVFVISPQSTLDKEIVPWETRYQKVWSRDFSGPYGDAAQSSQAAGTVNLMFDPYVDLDARHAARFDGPNVVHWRCPMLGHRLGSSLQQMGILHEIASKSIQGQLDHITFYQLLRKRHDFPRYQRELANLALDRNRPHLAAKVCDYVLSRQDSTYFSNMKQRL